MPGAGRQQRSSRVAKRCAKDSKHAQAFAALLADGTVVSWGDQFSEVTAARFKRCFNKCRTSKVPAALLLRFWPTARL